MLRRIKPAQLALSMALLAFCASASAISTGAAASPTAQPNGGTAAKGAVAGGPGESAPAAPRDDDSASRERVMEETAAAWRGGDFAALDSLSSRYRDLSLRTASGKPLMSVFSYALLSSIDYPGPAEDGAAEFAGCKCSPDPSSYAKANALWDSVGAKIDAWIAARPQSSTAYAAKAAYFEKRAHFFRGSAPSAQARPEAWPLIKKSVEQSGLALAASYALDSSNPLWSVVALSIMGAEGAPREAIARVVDNMAKSGRVYEDAVVAAMFYSEPRWGGSYAAIESLARAADAGSAGSDSGAMYASTYWGLAAEDPALLRGFFAQTKAEWPRMKKSFSIMVSKHPTIRNYNGYALFACLANDAPLAQSLLARAGSAYYFDAATNGAAARCEPEAPRAKRAAPTPRR